ncbi:MAG: hypothetical protein ACJA01_004605 [Saprospiraceae bacterium]|jgi:hypothetical protein
MSHIRRVSSKEQEIEILKQHLEERIQITDLAKRDYISANTL